MNSSLSEGGKKLFSSLFWKDFAERLVATLAQVALGLLTADATAGAVNWETWVITLAVAALGVFVKATAATRVDNTVSPASLAPASPDQPAKDKEEASTDAVGVLGD